MRHREPVVHRRGDPLTFQKNFGGLPRPLGARNDRFFYKLSFIGCDTYSLLLIRLGCVAPAYSNPVQHEPVNTACDCIWAVAAEYPYGQWILRSQSGLQRSGRSRRFQ